MRKVFILAILLTIILVGGVVALSRQGSTTSRQASSPTPAVILSPTTSLPFTAHFLIFTNGTRRIFTDSRYHNLSPNVYIAPDETNSITVTKQGITWEDFFATLPMKLTKDCLTTGTGQEFCSNETAQLTFYVNGQSEPDALDKEIIPGDRLLVSYGQAEAIIDQLRQLEEIE